MRGEAFHHAIFKVRLEEERRAVCCFIIDVEEHEPEFPLLTKAQIGGRARRLGKRAMRVEWLEMCHEFAHPQTGLVEALAPPCAAMEHVQVLAFSVRGTG